MALLNASQIAIAKALINEEFPQTSAASAPISTRANLILPFASLITAYFESSFRPLVKNPSSSARGLFGILAMHKEIYSLTASTDVTSQAAALDYVWRGMISANVQRMERLFGNWIDNHGSMTINRSTSCESIIKLGLIAATVNKRDGSQANACHALWREATSSHSVKRLSLGTLLASLAGEGMTTAAPLTLGEAVLLASLMISHVAGFSARLVITNSVHIAPRLVTMLPYAYGMYHRYS